MDESGNDNADMPLIVGAVAIGIEADHIEAEIRLLHEELSARRQLIGLPSFERFRRVGFHAKDDLPEISLTFMEYIQRCIGIRSYMLTSNREALPLLSEAELIEHMYVELLADIRARYVGRSEIVCRVEQGNGLGQLIARLPRLSAEKAYERAGRALELPDFRVSVVAKHECLTLGIVDYIMMAVSRWMRTGSPLSATSNQYRTFRAIEPKISMLRSLELGVITNRGTALHRE